MAILNKLLTKGRLAAWGMEVELECVLCHHELESRNHLFFGCNFSYSMCQHILQLCGIMREVTNWDGELNWAVHKLKGKAWISTILRIAWCALVYRVWHERNHNL